MALDDGQDEAQRAVAHRVTWFAPDRPVEGVTVFVRPTQGAGEGDPTEDDQT